MAELPMFPQNGNGPPEVKIARLEAHVYHLSLKQRDLEQEHKELKKDREALLRYIMWRLVIFSGLLIGALASKGSTGGSLIRDLLHALIGSFG